MRARPEMYKRRSSSVRGRPWVVAGFRLWPMGLRHLSHFPLGLRAATPLRRSASLKRASLLEVLGSQVRLRRLRQVLTLGSHRIKSLYGPRRPGRFRLVHLVRQPDLVSALERLGPTPPAICLGQHRPRRLLAVRRHLGIKCHHRLRLGRRCLRSGSDQVSQLRPQGVT